MTTIARGVDQLAVRRPMFARLARRLHRDGIAATAALSLVVFGAFAGPELWQVDPNATDLANRFAGASAEAPLGTDDFGRDMLARLMEGGRRSLLGAAVVVAGSTSAGLIVGIASTVSGRRTQATLARLIDATLAMPTLVIAMAIVGILGTGFTNLVLALVLVGWPWYARLYRGLTLQQLTREYIVAAESLGCSRLRIAWRHIGPNIAGPAIVLSTTSLGAAILGLASLSFLGLGIQPPHAEWGQWWTPVGPGFKRTHGSSSRPASRSAPQCSRSTCWAMSSVTLPTRRRGQPTRAGLWSHKTRSRYSASRS
ncbi:MAG: ABC transporter permease [Dehalococcoidia bacterium]